MPQSILYYPTINISDSPWLRSVVLYWDEICSIVPYEDYPDLSPELLYLEKRGQYRCVYPENYFNNIDSSEIANVFMRRIRGPHFSQAGKFRKNQYEVVHTKKIFNPALATAIHYRKIPNRIIDDLLETGLVRIISNDGWIQMDRRVAQIYMKTLAEYIAKHQRDMVIGSDKNYKLDDIYRQTGPRRDRQVVTLLLNECLPIPSMDVGFEYILDFKEHWRDDLIALRIKIADFERALSECDSPRAVENEILKFRNSWQTELRSAERMFTGARINFALGSLRSFIQDAGGAYAVIQMAQAMGANPSTSIIGAAAGINGLIGIGMQYRSYRNKINAAQQHNGFAYIVGAQQNGLLKRNEQITIL